MNASIHMSSNGQPSTLPPTGASATVDKNLLETPRGPVTKETVTTLAEGGFSGEFVALAEELAGR